MTDRPATTLNVVISLVSRKRDMASSDVSNEATTPSHAARPSSADLPATVPPSVKRSGEPIARPSNRTTESSVRGATSPVGQPPEAPVDVVVFGLDVVLVTTLDETDGRLTRPGSAFDAPVTAWTRPA